MDETNKLLQEFFKQNKVLVSSTILFQIINALLDSVIVPLLLAGTFNNIDNPEIFKKQLIKLVLSWIIIKIVFSISLHYQNKIDPELSKFIAITIIKSVFKKYEKESKITNLSLLIDKIHLIKNNLHEFSYLICTIFIPRIIVLFINCINIFTINKKIGMIAVLCIISQLFIITRGLDDCTQVTLDEYKNKDIMYEYIEDLFSNINIIQSTSNGYDFEIKNLNNISETVKKGEKDSSDCINRKQYTGYGTNIIIFTICIYNIYKCHLSGELNNKDTTKVILLLIGLFNNMSDMTSNIPYLTYKFGILKTNEDFLKDLIIEPENRIKHNFSLSQTNSNIDFKNVSFNYGSNEILKNFSIVIPENKIICIYGGIGLGKSTFVKLIFKIIEPKEGTILIGGQDISKFETKEIREYISYIDQSSNQLFNRTIIDNIVYGQEITVEEKNKIMEEIKNVLTNFDLYDVFKNLDKNGEKWSFLNSMAGKYGNNLSGGQKQIIHLLRIQLNTVTKIVILDEPTSHLDPVTRDKVLKLIKYINSKGKTILIITHDDGCKTVADKILEFSSNKNPEYL